ncbi:MAG: hypothetical protein JW881_20715 [Spirochaetales bacterium]|nr:hypothetical protein [Spirochaetales bacterium]
MGNRKERKQFTLYMVINAVSFFLLSGNIITLFALKLGAGNILIGVLSSFLYISYLMPLIGRKLAPRFGMIGLMGGFMLVRYLCMIPLLFTPLAGASGNPALALILCSTGVFTFNVARGIAVTAYNPIIGSLATEKDRGSFFSRLALANHLASIAVNIAIALLLGKDASLGMYTVFIGAGIATGIVSSIILLRIPEPRNTHIMLNTGSLRRAFSNAFRRKDFRRFMASHLSLFFVTAMIGPFLIVFMKHVYRQPDSVIVYFIVAGSLGAIVMALASVFLLDRLGAKPLYFFYSLFITLVSGISCAAPVLLHPFVFSAYAGLLFFFFRFGESGLNNAGLVYFFSTITEDERLDLGAVYQISMGLSASAGSVLGGLLLDGIEAVPTISSPDVFRIYFGGLLVLSLLVNILILRLDRQGAYSIKDAFSVIFSPRDWNVIGILNRLQKSETITAERDAIKALGGKPSGLSVAELLRRLESPRFSVRAETLNALGRFPITDTIAAALIKEVARHEFTTAFLAAKILGKKMVKKAVPVLRNSLRSGDCYLSGKAMTALARLEDRKSIAAIETIITESDNPRLIIHGALALERYRHVPSIEALLKKMCSGLRPFIQDEIILAVSGIIGFGSFFYPLYRLFLQSGERARILLSETIDKKAVHDKPYDDARITLKRIIEEGFVLTCTEGLSLVLKNLPESGNGPSFYFLNVLRNHPDPPKKLVFLMVAYIVWRSSGGGTTESD